MGAPGFVQGGDMKYDSITEIDIHGMLFIA